MSNVLVYDGPGVSSSALHHTLKTLRALLPSYDVKPVDARTLALDPWPTTSLLVLPGGRDLPYVSELAKPYPRGGMELRAVNQVDDYVRSGGSFLGICAGAYYASSYCLFEAGTPLQVQGDRPLRFFPGTCQGTVYPGFVYESDVGARIVQLRLKHGETVLCHYNGGGAFMDAEAHPDVEVLARYVPGDEADKLKLAADQTTRDRPDYSGQAAAVLCSAGKGKALLWGTHPEFPLLAGSRAVAGGSADTEPTLRRKEQELLQHEKRRLQLFKHMLCDKLGLHAELPDWAADKPQLQAEEEEPKLLPILMASLDSSLEPVLAALQAQAAKTKATSLDHLPNAQTQGTLLSYKDSNDTLHAYPATAQSEQALFELCRRASYDAFAKPVVLSNKDEAAEEEMQVDLDSVPKYLLLYGPGSLPPSSLTPYWDVEAYRNHLAHFTLQVEAESASRPTSMTSMFGATSARIGRTMLYAEMVTSTQTMLDKNFRFLSTLPEGTTFFATQQMSGRGRGGNRWISPKGCLQFSTVLRLPVSQASKAVFLQYLSALAIVEGVRRAAGDAVGRRVRIKWPNDVYAEIPSSATGAERAATFSHGGRTYCKMAGILVNSQFGGGKEMTLIAGCGVNCLNSRPTTSVDELVRLEGAEPVGQEKLAGAIMATLEDMWRQFTACGGGFGPFVERYRRAWLHSDQEVLLGADAVGGEGQEERVRIVGISSDHGLLRAVRLSSQITSDDPAAWSSGGEAHILELQPDGNSFDMLQNMVRRKV